MTNVTTYIIVLASMDKLPLYINGQLYMDEFAPIWQTVDGTIYRVGSISDYNDTRLQYFIADTSFIKIPDSNVIPTDVGESYVMWTRVPHGTAPYDYLSVIGLIPIQSDDDI